MNYWIGVVAGDHARRAQADGICAFSHGKRGPVEKLATGDRFAFYSPRTGISDGAPVQAFTALGTVTGDAAYEREWADTGHVAWVRDADYVPCDPIPVKPMLEDLGFVSNPRYWGMAFRRSLFQISAEDFALIEAQS